MGTCPTLNVDPNRLADLSAEPSCDCPWPSSLEEGYTRVGSVWNCSAGYAGTVTARCIKNPDCTFRWLLSGCLKKYPCRDPGPLFAATPGQCQNVEPGETCLVRCLPTTCVAGGPLQVHCPPTNTDPERLPDISGQCRVRCEVCDLGSFWDVDARSGYVSGNLLFGPAHAEGGVLTSGIEGYNVYFATSCLKTLGEAVAYIPSNTSEPRACCMPDQYMAVLRGLPVPDGGTRIFVTVTTASAGELPAGVATNLFDRSWNFTKPTGGVKATVRNSAKPRCGGPHAARYLIALVTSFLSTSRRVP